MFLPSGGRGTVTPCDKITLLTHFELPLVRSTLVCLQCGSKPYNWILEAQINLCLSHVPPRFELTEVFLPRSCLLLLLAVSTHLFLCLLGGCGWNTSLRPSQFGGERGAWREERRGNESLVVKDLTRKRLLILLWNMRMLVCIDAWREALSQRFAVGVGEHLLFPAILLESVPGLGPARWLCG